MSLHKNTACKLLFKTENCITLVLSNFVISLFASLVAWQWLNVIMEGLNLTSKAQVVISCHRCDRSVNVFCNNCQINLCVACVGKHVDESKSLSHDIIHLKNRKLQMVTPYCKLHPSKRCEVYCKQCDTPACAKCLIGPHKWHEA